MQQILNKTKEFIFAQQTSIFSSTLLLAGMMVVSRIAGFIRYRILAGYFSPEQLDIFFAAFRIPDLVFEILITGALSTTLIPFFIKFQKNTEEQGTLISSVLNIIIISLGVLITLLAIFLPYLMFLIVPGFSPEKTQQVILFSRILLIGQLPFLVLGNFLTGISQAKKAFIIPAVVPIVYNLAIIALTYLFADQLKLMAPVLGVVAGAMLFLILQLPILYFSDFKYSLVIKYGKDVWEFFKTAIPRMFTIIISQIDATVDLTLASLLGQGAYTTFYLAQHLQLLPVSIFGVTFGQASLPYLTEMYQKKKIEEFKKVIVHSILNLFYLTIPVAAFFIFARTPIVRLFFGGEKFDWDATRNTAFTLSYFAVSLPFHTIYYFLTRCFYAVFDTKTPFLVGLFSITFNAICSMIFILILQFPVWSLAISFSLSIMINVCILLFLLYQRLGNYGIQFLVYETIKIAVATFNASIITYFMLRLFDGLILDTTRTINVFLLLTICGIVYIILYLFLTWLFGIKEMYLITKMLLKVKEYQKKVVEVYKGVE
jgi:putative peptidoglycan lipid II flippase